MTDKDSVLQLLCAALRTEGLLLRGGFHPEPNDDAPPGTATLLLIGNAGPEMWYAFEKGRRRGTDRLNDWTRRVLSGVADRFGAAAIFPFDGPPYAPFFGWARQAEAVSESPIGMMIHPAYGLWLMACVARGACLSREACRAGIRAGAEALRWMQRQTMPHGVSGRCVSGRHL